MNNENVYEPGDILELDNGKTLIAVPAATDGSGCYVCDDGKHKCYFLDKGNCPKCHSSVFGFIDYVGGRVIFLENVLKGGIVKSKVNYGCRYWG